MIDLPAEFATNNNNNNIVKGCKCVYTTSAIITTYQVCDVRGVFNGDGEGGG